MKVLAYSFRKQEQLKLARASFQDFYQFIVVIFLDWSKCYALWNHRFKYMFGTNRLVIGVPKFDLYPYNKPFQCDANGQADPFCTKFLTVGLEDTCLLSDRISAI